jgi:hypothetical protein
VSTIADLLIKVRADTGGAEKDISAFGSKVGSGFKKSLLPATAALGVMGIVGKAAFANLQDGAKNAAQTNAVIKSTGDASNVTSAHVDDLAMSLRRKAGVDDDVVHAGENMLLTFTNIRNEVGKGNDIFDQSTKTMLDMSHALGQDTKSSAIQLGKALNDPIKGVTALQRVGVSFTASQKDQIKTMVAAGNTMGAQKLILGELNREFGGSAEKIDPTTKSLANLKLDSVDLASSLVQSLMPALQIVVGALQGATAFMTEHGTATKILVGILVGLALGILAVNAAMKLYAAGQLIVKAATALWTAAQWLLNAALTANPIGLVIIALVLLGAAIVVAWTKSETFRRIVIETWNGIKTAVQAVVTWFTVTVPGAFEKVIAWVRANWPIIATLISGPFAPIVALATNAFGVRSALEGAFDAVKTAVVTKLEAMIAFMTGVPGRIVGALGDLSGLLSDAGRALVDGFKNGIESALGGLLDKAHSMADKVKGVVSSALGIFSPSRVFHDIGINVVEGMVRGIDGHLPNLALSASGIGATVEAHATPNVTGPALASAAGANNTGDVVLMLDGEVLARFTRRELSRKGQRNVGLSFGTAH